MRGSGGSPPQSEEARARLEPPVGGTQAQSGRQLEVHSSGPQLSIADAGSRGKVISAFSAPTGLSLRDCGEQRRVFRVSLKLWGQACPGQGAGVTAAGVTSPQVKKRRAHAAHFLSTVSCVTSPDSVCSPKGGQPLESTILIADTVR